ncbi:hypothetical protein XHC_2399 [Xanthomonas hortorum pv. carotae str. M081]|nr:hypothetical protein XHC_2399 [Xanthomonas hortorum pv. carotae str. M081]
MSVASCASSHRDTLLQHHHAMPDGQRHNASALLI